MKHFRLITPILLIISAFLMGSSAWNIYMNKPWTRNAKIHSEIIKIAPKVSGEIVNIHVHDNQKVKKGDLLFTIEASDYQHNVDELTANVNKLNFQLKQNQSTYQRDYKLLTGHLVPEEQVTNEGYVVQASKAALNNAKAELSMANLNLSRTKIYAPADGYITNLNQRIGNYINVGETFVALVEKNTFYAMGYFSEAKIKNIHQGDVARVTLFSSDQNIIGSVQSIGRAIEDQSADLSGLVPDVEPTVPWVRVGQRVPVRIKFTSEEIANHRLISGTTASINIEH
ncbi:HlyD family secretion protein [Vibrio sp. SS-MA-C1-2]|uniref:efflux RND transporter periplasmic adaptor subunit n=1 Tax=Vibrio sp. SS-MA-C1-2 TaxID=2908646 RepID=UPI001F40A08A|nr:HlyD family secretion protein [Vibrio sp. SS-MA-C1-2]UJF16991.1 HlyD family secretion protein [Vibrio sp. SS-MA-C1-2]